ncbi:MAG: hypothetical protein PHV74_12310 [Dehalococcoidia bacterium]|nr:hypothetical protein [Dehalococcoidia bacterium]
MNTGSTLALTLPIVLFPVIVALYLLLGGSYAMLRDRRRMRSKRNINSIIRPPKVKRAKGRI